MLYEWWKLHPKNTKTHPNPLNIGNVRCCAAMHSVQKADFVWKPANCGIAIKFSVAYDWFWTSKFEIVQRVSDLVEILLAFAIIIEVLFIDQLNWILSISRSWMWKFFRRGTSRVRVWAYTAKQRDWKTHKRCSLSLSVCAFLYTENRKNGKPNFIRS